MVNFLKKVIIASKLGRVEYCGSCVEMSREDTEKKYA